MLTKSQQLEIYYWLRLTRTLEERIASLCRTEKIPGAVYTSRGQEALSVGAAYALREPDILAPMYRNLGALLVRGIQPKEVLAQYLGRNDSPARGREGCPSIGDLRRGIISPIDVAGAMVPVITGVAWTLKILNRDAVALIFVGDGGTATTDFHEGLNLAAVQKVPMVMMVENNGYAFSTPTDQHAANPSFVMRAQAYGIKGFELDGNDVLAVYEAVSRSIELTRRGSGPVLIEARTMRMRGCTEDDNAWYVPREVLNEWKGRDPIRRFEKSLIEIGVLSTGERNAILNRVRAEVEEATVAADKAELPFTSQAAHGVYDETPTR
jgi:TPP-dependent pyruvate/acetoin dehydrogenase alpha subunit